MSTRGSVTGWIGELKAGDGGAAQHLWERYFGRLTALARKIVRAAPRRAADEEDVALSAFDSFCRGAQRGRFPRLHDRDDLWRLLVVITARKAIDLVQHERRRKRRDSGAGPESAAAEIDNLLGRDPDPVFAALVADECRRLLNALGADDLRAIALWKMEGYSNAEIADRMGCARRTVERKLVLIRSVWAGEEEP
jgi:DNA-directed RNA polymerase specialized sigma24 family protein